jgi:hypothetical protein
MKTLQIFIVSLIIISVQVFADEIVSPMGDYNDPYAVKAPENYATINNAPNNNRSNMIILPNNKFEKTYIYSEQQLKAEKDKRKDDKKNG